MEGEEFPRLSTMDIRARRNAYGRQLGSFHTSLDMAEVGTGLPATFIRAPYIESLYKRRLVIPGPTSVVLTK